MISIGKLKKYCKEDISLIENYEQAISDQSQIWECHHRLEIQGDKITSRQELKDKKLYYHRPANELIFLTHEEHSKLHHDNISNKTRIKISQSHLGSCRTKEQKERMSKAQQGRIHSEETKLKISKSKKGNIPWNKGLKLKKI